MSGGKRVVPTVAEIVAILKDKGRATTGWMSKYSASGSGPGSHNLEVEARVRGATRPGFQKLLGYLVGNPAWTHAEFRETRAYTLPGKERLISTRIVAPGTVAAAVAAGVPSKGSAKVPPPPGHGAAPGSWEQETKGRGSPVDFTVARLERDSFQRIKRRWSFVHKAEVRYDLTEVQEGRSAAQADNAQPNYEVELEWVGAKSTAPAEAADKLLFKVADVLLFLARHAAETPAPTFVEALLNP
ncbi:hypothetical protein FNF27_03609 [Cafeteria roenbergensis]|uniref:mRNA 5'-phosphatase n=1 Tax=Cafeteria roenbergensis TaxID=33653 RepID=A0A5A8ECJ1_CAFRO|nr:hypothetical protein FNF29_05266 [Cafeteria roenbergensis]KAA0174894.1 hypothetical protein FNF27_03609 [Cafeteria roenbergensis]|eukprot:KAA0150463.1 hypothetical protein FNF29_05266 [Cafeteria roenbergensis]